MIDSRDDEGDNDEGSMRSEVEVEVEEMKEPTDIPT